MRGNEAFGYEIIRRLQEQFPSWKMNVKYDIDRKKAPMNKMYQNQNQPMQYQRPNMSYQNYPQMPRAPYQNYQSMSSNTPINNSASSS